MGKRQSIFVENVRSEFVSVIESLEARAWQLQDVEGLTYLPADAADESEWAMFSSALPADVKAVCRARESEQLIAGVVMMHGDGQFGAQFLWTADRTLIGSVEIGVPDPLDLSLSQSILEALAAADIRFEFARVCIGL